MGPHPPMCNSGNLYPTVVSEVATVVRNLVGRGRDLAMSGEMGNAGAMRMSRADSALLARAGEDHLGIGTHERQGWDPQRPWPSGPAPPRACRRRPGRQAPRPPGAEDGEGDGEKPRSSSLDVERVLLGSWLDLASSPFKKNTRAILECPVSLVHKV
eukprot:scaffold23232_cov131-Isochrysis_galbana.AAC.13